MGTERTTLQRIKSKLVKSQNPLGFMTFIKQMQLHATKDYNPCFSPTRQTSFRRRKKKVEQLITCFTNIRDYIKQLYLKLFISNLPTISHINFLPKQTLESQESD